MNFIEQIDFDNAFAELTDPKMFGFGDFEQADPELIAAELAIDFDRFRDCELLELNKQAKISQNGGADNVAFVQCLNKALDRLLVY